MADFLTWLQPGKRRYRRIFKTPTYQNIPNDAGNWTGGVIGVGIQAGTNHSISAPVLSAWRGHPVTAQEMQALSAEEAIQIYKIKYWDKILGDQIKSQVMAEFIGDMKSSMGNIIPLQKALNDIGYGVAIDGAMGPQTLSALNDVQDAGKTPMLYNAYRVRMIEHYNTTSFASQLIEQLNDDYPPRAPSDTIFNQVDNGGMSMGAALGLGIILSAVIIKIRKNRRKR